jgi:hypothetical protein
LTRASKPFFQAASKDVDGWDKPGHDRHNADVDQLIRHIPEVAAERTVRVTSATAILMLTPM